MSKVKKYKDIEEFKINRATWLRGEGSSLLDGQGKMCCLGFYSLACGLKPSDIEHQGSPGGVVQDQEDVKWKTFLLYKDSSDSAVCLKLMSINDGADIDDKEREKDIKKIFKVAGVTVKFEG